MSGIISRTPALFIFASIIFIAAAPTPAHAQPPADHAALTPIERRITAAQALRLADGEQVKLDGKANEPFWSRATVIADFYEYRPREAAAKYKTEARIVYDKHAIYFAMRAYDPDPSQIEAPLVRRDQVHGSQDFFAVYLDPVGSRKFAQIFRVNAAGAMGDGIFHEDSQNENFSPDFEWDAAVARLADGWSAEIRIPFSVMRYASPPAENWSVFLGRGITRDNLYRISNGRIPRESNCLLCYAQTVSGLKDLPDGRELTVTPNITLRTTRDRESGVADKRTTDFVPSLDVKFRPTADWVFDGTLNPDFSQVELDSPQLAANAQFALFFQEKRPFFLEGSDILSTPFRTIYTRSITDPAWGLRATRRAEGMDLTILTVRDDGKGLILLPGSLNTRVAIQDTKSIATIGRIRLDSGAWTIGGVLTDRTYETTATKPTLTNQVIGGDVVWRPNGEFRIRGNALWSNTNDERNKINGKTSASDTAFLFDYNFSTDKWSNFGAIAEIGRDFRADNGFFSQVGTRRAYSEITRRWRDVMGLTELSPYLNLERKLDLDGRVLYQQQNLGVVFTANKLNFGIEARPHQKIRFRATGEPLSRSQVFGWLDWTPGNWLSSFHIESAIGERGDVANNRIGRGYYFQANATIRLFNRWEIQPRFEESVINHKDNVAGTATIIRERAGQLTSVYHLTARDSVRLIAQYNGTRRAPSLYESRVTPFDKTETRSLVYSHKRGLGTNFYLGVNSSRSIEPGTNYQRRINEIFFKASYAFDLAGLGRN